ncbi:peptidylprolyl isomerase [Candidatus Woesearchaeota archaeon]|nr:peptidylprolyl isomerase [Candidatus Woesearchaeota archaeon]
MAIKKGDFIEVEYTGRLKEEKLIFDTTDEKTAKEIGIHSKETAYGPVVICLGQGQLLPGIEKELEGKEPGKELAIDLQPEDAFGKKDAKLIKMIPMAAFKRQNIMPEPGMQVNVDNLMGIIKTAAGGRCLVDFNHPLSGKEVSYTIKINKIITDDKEKLKSFISLALNAKDVPIELKEGKAEVTTDKEVPKEIQGVLSDKVKELIPSIKELSFSVKQKEKVK